MSALEDINKKFNDNEMLTACEQAIGTLWEDVSGYEWLAEEAATELAALEAVAEAANQLVFHGDSRKAQWETLAATLAELEKARG